MLHDFTSLVPKLPAQVSFGFVVWWSFLIGPLAFGLCGNIKITLTFPILISRNPLSLNAKRESVFEICALHVLLKLHHYSSMGRAKESALKIQRNGLECPCALARFVWAKQRNGLHSFVEYSSGGDTFWMTHRAEHHADLCANTPQFASIIASGGIIGMRKWFVRP